MNIHDLNGCAPTPLAHYLKALGILRLVAEQADPEARGWWEGERFRLATRLDRGALTAFFMGQYQPTPMVSPWNKGSGFFYQDDPALSLIEKTQAERMGRFQNGISAARAESEELVKADQTVREIKAEAKDKSLSATRKKALKADPAYKKRLSEAEKTFKKLKADLVPRIRLAWRGPHREWMDAAMILGEDGNPVYPALLGTGGNDGRLDFTNNFMQRLNDVFDFSTQEGRPRPGAREWLDGSLWGLPAASCQAGKAVGQYLPGMAGGANSSNGPTGDSLLNPLDFLLMMEGTVLFTAHVTRRAGTGQSVRAAAPFSLNAQGAGYASAAASDESGRGEQWMPLWNHPMTLMELRRLLAEGRAQIGAKTVREPLDMARAIARLGAARGIVAFQRYGYIERNGQSNLAVPIGRFNVPDRVSPSLACLDDLDPWRDRLRRQARARGAAGRLQLVERRLADSLFAVAQHPEEANRWQAVLLALVDVETVLRAGSGFQAGPIPPLRPEWVRAADDGSAEIRLALACALQWPSVRRHWLPLKYNRFAAVGSGGQRHLEKRPEVVMNGRDGIEDAIALLGRRLVETAQKGERELALRAAKRASARIGDLARLLAGEVDVERTMALARAFMALDGREWSDRALPLKPPEWSAKWPDDAWLAVRLCFLPDPLPPEGISVPTDPAILRRLESGDAASAVERALQRLQAHGVGATVRAAVASPQTARLWAAALAFPISKQTAAGFRRRLDPKSS